MAKRKPKAEVTVQINEDTWTCRLWKSKTYEKMHGTDSGAITDPESKTIDFRDDEFTVETTGHELMHAYFKYLHLDSVVNPDINSIEEIIASWAGYNSQKFAEKVMVVYTGLTTKKDAVK